MFAHPQPEIRKHWSKIICKNVIIIMLQILAVEIQELTCIEQLVYAWHHSMHVTCVTFFNKYPMRQALSFKVTKEKKETKSGCPRTQIMELSWKQAVWLRINRQVISLQRHNFFPLSLLPTCPTLALSFPTTPGLGADNLVSPLGPGRGSKVLVSESLHLTTCLSIVWFVQYWGLWNCSRAEDLKESL